jgi:hypothetical protein
VTHRGQLLEFVGQYHTDIASETPGDVTSAVVEDAVARAAGTKVSCLLSHYVLLTAVNRYTLS